HEAAYVEKSVLKDYIPYVEGVGSAAVFKQGDLMFVAVDANFTRDGSDAPEDILPCREFTIPDAQIAWLKTEVAKQMDSSVKGIVWISHIALQDIDAGSQGKLLGELKSYGLPMSVFEGHTHIEAYTELVDQTTGEVYCKVYTLPAVTLVDKYPYYNVTFVNGEVWCVDKHTTGTIAK
ncbi:MAG: metallophosphoesterase, partial [Clostridia bacterium]|nr:metallophosphoesterase [Clostridia bacterium]